MRSNRMDAAVLHDDDAICGAHGSQTMRNHQRGAAAFQTFERGSHLTLGFGVERTGGLVKQQHRPVGEQRTRNRQALTLPP